MFAVNLPRAAITGLDDVGQREPDAALTLPDVEQALGRMRGRVIAERQLGTQGEAEDRHRVAHGPAAVGGEDDIARVLHERAVALLRLLQLAGLPRHLPLEVLHLRLYPPVTWSEP